MLKAKQIDDEQERKRFVDNELGNLFRKFDEFRSGGEDETVFGVVAYDKDQGGIRKMFVNWGQFVPINGDRVEIGSGSDGSNSYFSNVLQGINVKDLDLPRLCYLAMNGYCFSNVNHGVGGVPKLAIVEKDGVKILDRNKSICLANVSGAHLTGGTANLDRPAVVKIYEEVLSGKEADYDRISKTLDLTPNALCNLYIPFSSWQEHANLSFRANTQSPTQ